MIARAKVYGEKIEYSGPVFKEVRFEGEQGDVGFSHAGNGLLESLETGADGRDARTRPAKARVAWRIKPGSGGASLIGFTVCGEDGQVPPCQGQDRRRQRRGLERGGGEAGGRALRLGQLSAVQLV